MRYENVEVIALTRRLVQIESTNVGTFEGEISRFVADWLTQNTKAQVVRDEFEPGRFNVMATLKGKQAHPNLIYVAHMDTVPVGSDWTKDPFAAEIVDGKMYGRGAFDMKAGLACAMIAFRDFEKKCREEGLTPKYDFTFVGSGDEEDVMKGADRLVEIGLADRQTLVLDTEPTSGEIYMAHKGKTWFEISTKGKAAHGSTPYKGADAIVAMAEVILEIKNRLDAYPEDPVMGRNTVCFGTINGGFNTNIVADRCAIQIDVRLAPPLTNEGSIKLVEDAIEAATARVPGTSGSYRVIAQRPYVQINEDSFLLKSLQDSCEKITGARPQPLVFTGYTDSGVIDGSTGCKNGMSYGAAGAHEHQADEYVECDSVIQSLEVYKDLTQRILL
ncbi:MULTISPECIES: M20 family metallopeptidase [Anaerotruncus]|uniref:M20 family metallopeptidase n=5 Tax=Oscillospiraceae TaxID=216572 RepID=UPI000E484C16|nr:MULTISPECIES: M20 family metallopeptidase [Anaerotruncus]RGX54729.1 M20 family peptidase [Anaerotruncus sp. AF02-27]